MELAQGALGGLTADEHVIADAREFVLEKPACVERDRCRYIACRILARQALSFTDATGNVRTVTGDAEANAEKSAALCN